MPTPTRGPRLGGSPAHEQLMLANLATSLFKHGKITTTETKAKRLRPFAEHLITRAKRGDLASFRRVLRVIHELDVAYELRDQIAPRYADRNGGYTRIIKAGVRKGDAAPMAIIELVEESESKPAARTAKSAARRLSRADSVVALTGETEPKPRARVKPAAARGPVAVPAEGDEASVDELTFGQLAGDERAEDESAEVGSAHDEADETGKRS